MATSAPVKPLLLLAILAAAPAPAQDEDAAHRADRLEVQRLNGRSWNGYAGSRHATASSSSERAYAKAQADYEQRLEAWRRRVAACESGQYDACE